MKTLTAWWHTVLPTLMTVLAAIVLWVLIHTRFHPHGVLGYVELLALIATGIAFLWFAVQTIYDCHLVNRKPARHTAR